MAAVLRRRAPLLLAALALLAGAGGASCCCAAATTTAPRRRRAEPLAYVPAGSADVVFDLDTREPLVALAVEQLAPRVTHGALTADQAHALVGGRVAVAIDAGKAWLAFATDAPAPRPTSGAAAAARDGVVVVAPSPADLGGGRSGRARPVGASTRARPSTSASRACPPRPAPASPSTPKSLLAQRSPAGANTAWGRSLRDGAAVLTTRGAELGVPFRVTADPVGLSAADLPLATGPQPPQARGSAPLVARAARPGAHPRLRAPAGLLQQLDLLDQLPGFLKPDLSEPRPQRHGHEPSLDLTHLTARFEPPDPGDWATKLGRIDTLAGPRRQGGARRPQHRPPRRRVHGDEQRPARRPRRRLRPRARALQRPDRQPARGGGGAGVAPPPGAAGALTARLRSSVLATQIPELIRARVGDLTAWARAELTGVTGELRLALR